MDKWDKRFLELAKHVASWSKDPSTKVGSIITDDKNRVVSLGYNGFPRGVNDNEEYLNDREKKYQRVIHAEPNAILFAKQDLAGSTIYTYPFPPCNLCSTLIVQSGIKRVVAPEASEDLKSRWSDSMKVSLDMFNEADVVLDIVDNDFNSLVYSNREIVFAHQIN